jgi:hypothetical protein
MPKIRLAFTTLTLACLLAAELRPSAAQQPDAVKPTA